MKKYFPIILILFLSSCFFQKNINKDKTFEYEAFDTIIVVEANSCNYLNDINIVKYQQSRKRNNNLVHTKLDLQFDWENEYVLGKATITLSPHFYETDKLILDAVYFDIHKVALIEKKDTSALKFEYDSTKINIQLPRKYNKNEEYTIYIDYTAKPSSIPNTGNWTFKDTKGLYFINSTGKNKDLHQQIWTQGETQYSSCWFPTIDAPNQRCTQEMFITVDNKFTTLSNGILYNTLLNIDTTRTDHWKMDKPHAPYLFMLAVGEFEKITTDWHEMEVSYYVSSEYVEKATEVFSKTPEMIEFYSICFGLDYPWAKYSQIVVDEFVSGAMENTTATVFGDYMVTESFWYGDFDRELVIAHELSHHWFGDYVTCESWANTVLNEGFATYSEYLWTEYKYGKYEADMILDDELYYCYEEKNDDVVDFYYTNKDDMFGYTSYQKGARILHMLRKYVGDEAFFESIKLYLNKFAYKSAEIHDLRLCFEEITGEDLNWFFEQWYFASGYPILKIEKNYNSVSKTATITITQKQNLKNTPLYTLPIDIVIHFENTTLKKQVLLIQKMQSFDFSVTKEPLLIEIDPHRNILCKREEKELTYEEYEKQFYSSEGVVAKYEAFSFLMENTEKSKTNAFCLFALDLDYWLFRTTAINKYQTTDNETDKEFIDKLKNIQQNDPEKNVRQEAKLTLRNLGL